MKIIDLGGKEMTVTDLELAIMQADDYRHYRHTDPSFKLLDDGLQAYWEDVYQKLLRLKSE
ncbi:hypothetical protein [Mucilaginibacter ginsenosidivorax]|uniref:3-isopropylmalate dehydratase n=1 Tax=Mucilaginibacter ginsenosidivorax TaxID=862126 RepID=A0A5B8VV09_9SPHI|nr:hypothetical protein [Mucilaginibacter ginsenosidivorax]QEC74722.1 hypothetical protein FSB76_01695 [Mucilaginibacter ginsenosidivorax]